MELIAIVKWWLDTMKTQAIMDIGYLEHAHMPAVLAR